MRTIRVIGIGPGDPRQITLEAIDAMHAVDVIYLVTKRRETTELVDLRRTIMDEHLTKQVEVVEIQDPDRERHPGDYRATVAQWRTARADVWAQAIREHDGDGGFLVWGDPAFYDSTLDVLADIRERTDLEFDVHVVAGISSVQLLAARHGIALNRIGGAIEVTPARRLRETWPAAAEDVVVMLDQGTAFAELDDPDVHLYWGAYLGTEDELLIDGPLLEVRDEVTRVRAEAKERKGWMFDTYLLRRAR